MKCTLCDKAIENYNPGFHHLKINESKSADICQGCLDRIVQWQARIVTKLFPTKALKRRWENK